MAEPFFGGPEQFPKLISSLILPDRDTGTTVSGLVPGLDRIYNFCTIS